MKDTAVIEGASDASGLRVGVVVSVYHASVTQSLRDGALSALKQSGASDETVSVISVPGAFEIPLAARRAAESGHFDAIVCLGCVIRGETPHFEYIAAAVVQGISMASQATGVPMTCGVLTTNSKNEAVARAGEASTNKGWEAAMAAVQLANVIRALPGTVRVVGE